MDVFCMEWFTGGADEKMGCVDSVFVLFLAGFRV